MRLFVQVSVLIMAMKKGKIKKAIIYFCHDILTKKKASVTLLAIIKRDAR